MVCPTYRTKGDRPCADLRQPEDAVAVVMPADHIRFHSIACAHGGHVCVGIRGSAIMERETAWNPNQHQVQMGWLEKCRLSFPVQPHITHEANGCVYRLDNVAFQGRKLVMAKSINRILNNRVDSIGDARVMCSFNDTAGGAQPLGHARLNGGLEFSVGRFQRHRRANGRVELRKPFDRVHLQALGLLQGRARRFERPIHVRGIA